jgi:hypothetical protein
MPTGTRGYVGKTLVILLVVALMAGFSPIAGRLLRLVNGSFRPTHYSALALSRPSGIESEVVDSAVQVRLTNHTGITTDYHWTATQNGTLISQGSQNLANGSSRTISVSTAGATVGALKISLVHTRIFLTLPLVPANS